MALPLIVVTPEVCEYNIAMNRSNSKKLDQVLIFAAAFLSVLVSIELSASAADEVKIQEAIRRGQSYLLKQRLLDTHGYGSLAALALIKSHSDKNTLPIPSIVEETLRKFNADEYLGPGKRVYEASVDTMLLEAIDPKKYRPEIESLAKYLISAQCENGAWYYPDRTELDAGDTSITQYAILGLWAAARTGITIPTAVWEKAAKWHLATQRSDGGFGYHPFAAAAGGEKDQISRNTMTGAGTSNLLIIRQVLFGDPAVRSANTAKRFGVLERLGEEKGEVTHTVTIRAGSIDDAVKNSLRWIGKNFAAKNQARQSWFTYDLYCIERVAALLGSDEVAEHRWYDEGCVELLARQNAAGGWEDQGGPISATSFALLFLSKSTQQIFKPSSKVNFLGGGLQAGGRGLPDNLDTVQNKDGTISARKMAGDIDNLLISLERSSDANVEEVQAATIDAVQLDRKDELIGQTARLRKLAVDPRTEVRRIAMWALGRSQDVTVAPVLIRGLADRDISVAQEASLGLCVLTRRPEGQGIAIDPTIDAQMGIKENATDDERTTVYKAWSTESIKRWNDWYLKNRPYDERDDKTSLKKAGR